MTERSNGEIEGRPCVFWFEENDEGGRDLVVRYEDGSGTRYHNVFLRSFESVQVGEGVLDCETICPEWDNLMVIDPELEAWKKMVSDD